MIFLNYERDPDSWLRVGNSEVAVFNEKEHANLDALTVSAFGEEWGKFDRFEDEEITRIGQEYFDVLDDAAIGNETRVLDAGCGSGRWSRYLAHKVHSIEAIDPSDAVVPAVHQLKHLGNVRVTKASIDTIPFSDESFDLIVCLGVLHHIPDTFRALTSLTKKLKKEGILILYLYYDLDNRGRAYRILFNVVDYFRRVISQMPDPLKRFTCECIALLVYLPLSRISRLVEKLGMKRFSKRIPLAYYADKNMYILRNDALDRFGTPLEQRFNRNQIEEMLTSAGYMDIRFSDHAPYWHLSATKSV